MTADAVTAAHTQPGPAPSAVVKLRDTQEAVTSTSINNVLTTDIAEGALTMLTGVREG